VLVTTEDGRTGWVPSRILRIQGDSARVLTEYDTTVLDPAIGEELEVLEEDREGRWIWCRDARSRTG